MRQRDEIDALGCERQLQRVGSHHRAGLEREREAEIDAVLSQKSTSGRPTCTA